MKRKRAEESLDANSEVLENKRALKREYMKNKRAILNASIFYLFYLL